ncbi:isoaspartyl peptidase/L-asparaginase [Rubrivirga sp. S365]|uniref:Isoaspartyl peptidase/L-asparaginase n=1 Tax=Rubrivirga litoralis TaxID=3075598 RepID=A0ABU3BSF3_9BACT|nr:MULTISPECIES: isoaspartyl peptidase/L-asparaginase [unclassified Rubrivirga]MDT0632198.1 isoaspartyl peptidase/L-asparaginase [Rubrivirga sp. F394]MDT7856808.1 isoaspartyl peptidase/L-asparaginase [Rubrivirga sp. S365]
MSTPLLLLGAAALLAAAAPAAQTAEVLPALDGDPVVLVVHGGAGTITRAALTDDDEAAIRAVLEQALRAGHAEVVAGRPALDAVTAAIGVLEDDPNFNAGRGGVFAADGTVRHDASVMDGATGLAGASTGTMHVRHPIRLARAVMDGSPHVLLSAEGAEEFALQQGLELVPNTFFHTERRLGSLRAVQERERSASGAVITGGGAGPEPEAWQMHGTVGAVALSSSGHLAAGTSTGGMTNKRWGRIGDSPLIGAGTYADDATCGVSATGHGEFFIRLGVARDIAARMAYLGEGVDEAATHVIHDTLGGAGGTGGVVALDAQGRASMPFNTEGMYRGTITRSGVVTTGIYGDE